MLSVPISNPLDGPIQETIRLKRDQHLLDLRGGMKTALQLTLDAALIVQDRLTTRLAKIYHDHPGSQGIVRVTLAAVGRGGQGEVGQRIRDEILTVQSRNNAKASLRWLIRICCYETEKTGRNQKQ